MASDRQISQLVLQVDANVAVAQRSLQDLARVVNQSATQMNTSLAANDAAIGRNLSSHHQLGLAFNNARIAQSELTAAVTRSIDAYGAGASPLRILSTEMGRLTEAASFLGGGAGNGVLGKITRFLGGPWGIALLLAGSIAAKLVTSHKDASDSVEALVAKMRKEAEQAQNSKIADAEWGATIDGLIDRNLKLIDTLQKRLKAEEDLDGQTLRSAQHDEARAESELQAAKTRLANLEAQQVALDAASTGATGGQRAESLAPVARQNTLSAQIAQAKADVATAEQAIATTRAAMVQNTIAIGEAAGKAAVEASAAIDLWSKKYLEFLHTIENANKGALAGQTDAISSGFYAVQKALQDAAGEKVDINASAHAAKVLGDELKAGKLTAQEYAEAMKKVAASLEAAAEAAKNAKKGAGEFGKQISFADAESIAKSAGLTVTSGYRSMAHQAELYNDPAYNHPGNPVARPGTSAHEGVNGKWALDIAFAPGLTADKLKKLYGDQGVSLSAVYKETGHFHIEGSRSQAAAAETAAARAAQKQLTDDDQFAKESAQLDAEILQARKALAAGYDTQAKYADDEIDAQKEELLDAIKKQVDSKAITAAQGKILSGKVEEVATAKKAVVDQRAYLQALEQSAKAVDQALGFQQDDLRFADDMATTQQEHRKLELQIIDIVYQRKQAELEALKQRIEANADFAKSADLQKQAALIQAQIDRLPTEKAQDQDRTRQQTMDPLAAWAHQVPHTAAQINEAFKSIEVQGIDNLASSIADVITGTKSLGAAFKDVAREIISEIVQMTVKMLIFKAISAVAGALGGGGISDPFAGGGGLGGASFSGGFDPGALSAPLPHLAGGGMFSVGGNAGVDQNMLSINGVPRAMVGANENIAVIPQASRINVVGANGGSAPIELIIQTVPSDDAWGKVQVISAQHANQAVRVSVNHTNDTVRSLTRPRLMGGRG